MNYEEATQAIACMCSDVDSFQRLFDAGLNPNLFIEVIADTSESRKIWQFTKDWYLRDGTVPPRSVLEAEFEAFFSSGVPDDTALQPEYVVKWMKNNAVKAHVQDFFQDAAERIFDEDADQVEELGHFHREISKFYVDVSSTGDVQDVSKAAPDVVASLFERAADADQYRKSLIKFPFEVMDQYYFGLRPRELALFYGYTGDMKSLTLEQTSLANALSGKRVAHFTFENGIEVTVIRMLALLSGLPMSRLSSGGIQPKEMAILNEAKDKLASLDIMLDQSAGLDERSVEAIYTKARSHQAELVTIDQATWISAPDVKYGSMWENLATIVRRIKQYTNELGVATVLASQANRKSQSSTKGTSLDHVAGSDELTKTATMAATLDFDKASGLLKVMVVKNRNGSASLEFTMNVDLDTRTDIRLNQVIST